MTPKEPIRAEAVGGGKFVNGTALRNKGSGKAKAYRVPAKRKWVVHELTLLLNKKDIYFFWVAGADEWNIRIEKDDAWSTYTWEQIQEFVNARKRPAKRQRKRSNVNHH